jgi:hypothetical protein
MKLKTMIDLSAIPLPEHSKRLIEESVSSYWRLARIEISLGPDDAPNAYNVVISQKALVNDRILTDDELISRGRKVFEGLIPDNYILNYEPHRYTL